MNSPLKKLKKLAKPSPKEKKRSYLKVEKRMTDIEASRVTKCPRCGANLSVKLVCELKDAETYQAPIEHSKVYNKFPSDLAVKLDISHVDKEYVYLKPRVWLKGEDFSTISSIVKELHGSWVSAGKNSAFKIPRDAFV